MLKRFGAEHVVLGTDYPLPLGPDDPVGEIQGLGLKPEDERKILGENAAQLLGLT